MKDENFFYATGNLTRQPNITATRTGGLFAAFSIASNDSYVGKDGQEHTSTTYINCSTFVNADALKYLGVGDKIAVKGKLKENKYTDKNGIERTGYKVECESVSLIRRSRNSQQNIQQGSNGGYSGNPNDRTYSAAAAYQPQYARNAPPPPPPPPGQNQPAPQDDMAGIPF